MKTIFGLILQASLMALFVHDLAWANPRCTTEVVYDVHDFGAKGDGEAIDTKAIQKAIDLCHSDGGGRVYFKAGRFLSGTVYLKSNVTLYIEAGATLVASPDLEDFPISKSRYQSYKGTYLTNKMLIYAEDADNIGLEGRGLIDGNGDHWIDGPYGSPSFSVRPRIIHFRGCKNIHIRNLKLINSASWVQSYQDCRNLIITGITVDSRENTNLDRPRYADAPGRNCDGLDIVDCQVVRISNCFINSGDDAIVIKSLSPINYCCDIAISNCVLSSHAAGIKIGTESAGGFQDIVVQNCTVFDTRGDGIALMTVDGGFLERITISNVSMRNIRGVPIFIRLGARLKAYHTEHASDRKSVKNIMISKIQATGVGGYGCSITGLPGSMVEGITLSDISIEYEDGGKILDKTMGVVGDLPDADRKAEINRSVSEHERSYPGGRMFGRLPSYGFFLRHAKQVRFENIRLSLKDRDIRPAIVCDDVEDLLIQNVQAESSVGTEALIRFFNVREATLVGCRVVSKIPTFLWVEGSRSTGIQLIRNVVDKADQEILYAQGAEDKR